MSQPSFPDAPDVTRDDVVNQILSSIAMEELGLSHVQEDYERQMEAINEVISNLNEEKAELENGIDTEKPFLVTFRKYENIDKLTRDVLTELVEQIKVHENGNISVKFKFADELRRVIEYIEINTQSKAV